MARGWIDAGRRRQTPRRGDEGELLADRRGARARDSRRRAECAERRTVEERFDDLLIELDELAPTFRDCRRAIRRRRLESQRQASTSRADARHARAARGRARDGSASEPALPACRSSRMLNRHELRAAARAALVGDPWCARGARPGDVDGTDAARHPRPPAAHDRASSSRRRRRRSSSDTSGTRHDGVVRFKVIRGLVKLRRNNPHIELDPDAAHALAEETLEHAEELQRWGKALLVDATAMRRRLVRGGREPAPGGASPARRSRPRQGAPRDAASLPAARADPRRSVRRHLARAFAARIRSRTRAASSSSRTS